MLNKTYCPLEVEADLYEGWERSGAFLPDDSREICFCCVLPPPNVTGSLHMGHALNVTIQDVLCRFERMRGKNVLWQPGTDHAGIATQMVVERKLEKDEGLSRRQLGRSAFLEKVWEWKEASGSTIVGQLKRLGASCDWSRARFTMDEGMSRAVARAFVVLYRDGLVYRDKRLVNWDPALLTAVSDLEVEQCEVEGCLWYLKYPFSDGSGRFLTIATTRPETLFGDVAVAVHPDDARYADAVGKTVVVPLVGREIPVITDFHADPEKGTGVVKITPAHDFKDFDVGKRHNLEAINIFDQSACLFLRGNEDFLRDLSPSAAILDLHGLDRVVARERVVELLQQEEFLERSEEHRHAVPFGDRSQAVIEPRLTEQWYVDARVLAAPALRSVREGRTVFVPKAWEKTYFDWLENIEPWCISRQLWWGHRIPVWYGPALGSDGKPCFTSPIELFVGETESEVLGLARAFYPAGTKIVFSDEEEEELSGTGGEGVFQESGSEVVVLRREKDVLDTWFSSALWPFSTLGWPEETPQLERFYPTSVLVTGFDIIFFWVARMMMMGLHLRGEEPFQTVYIHALVRDERGQKMSKSKGNVLDPLDLIETYGADVLRFSLIALAAQGRDIKLAKGRVEGYRNFTTKIWNAVRFAEMNGCAVRKDFQPEACKTALARWIVGEVGRVAADVTAGIEGHRYNESAQALYHFVWHVFCDWYLEFAKPVLSGSDLSEREEIQAVTAWVITQLLLLLHPFMPFITEELWRKSCVTDSSCVSALDHMSWPDLGKYENPDADMEMEWVCTLITKVRSIRVAVGLPAKSVIPMVLLSSSQKTEASLSVHSANLSRLARVEYTGSVAEAPEEGVCFVVGEATFALCLAGVVDLAAERARLERECSKVRGQVSAIKANLENESFLNRAPEHVLEEQRVRYEEVQKTYLKILDLLEQIPNSAK